MDLQVQLCNHLECTVCYNVFEHPVSLRCGHTFCRGCLDDLAHAHCPLCRGAIAGVFHENIVLREMSDIVRTCAAKVRPTPSQEEWTKWVNSEVDF